MRNLALFVVAVLVLTVAAPAFAQPFADVPTDHWAFDAIAELAAKGIIEGFPDGTFKGDRGVSRYEVAIIVARILARIEAIKIPAPAPAAAPQVTRTDVQTIQRLVNEFRAELAALGVRTTAVEEELTALKAKTTNVSVKGDVRFRYNFFGTDQSLAAPTIRFRNRLTFTGNSGGNATAVARASFGLGGSGLLPCAAFPCQAGQRFERFDFDLASPQGAPTVNFDLAYIDLKDVFGVNWRLGQQGETVGAVGWSGYDLLFDPSNADVFSAVGVADGLKASGSWSGFGYEIGLWRESPALDIVTARLTTGGLMPGWTLGVEGLLQRRNSTTYVAPTFPPGTNTGFNKTNATDTVTPVVLAAASNNTSDTGYQVDISGSVFPGVTLNAAYAGFNPDASVCAAAAVVVCNTNAYIVWAVVDLSTMGMSTFSPTLTVAYKNYGTTDAAGAVVPFHSGATTELDWVSGYDWNFKGFNVAVDMKISDYSVSLSYESGNLNVGAAPAVVEYIVDASTSIASNTTLHLIWYDSKIGAIQEADWYRVQMNYSY
jgi:hypothetical protein